jgi:hypothetical protein
MDMNNPFMQMMFNQMMNTPAPAAPAATATAAAPVSVDQIELAEMRKTKAWSASNAETRVYDGLRAINLSYEKCKTEQDELAAYRAWKGKLGTLPYGKHLLAYILDAVTPPSELRINPSGYNNVMKDGKPVTLDPSSFTKNGTYWQGEVILSDREYSLLKGTKSKPSTYVCVLAERTHKKDDVFLYPGDTGIWLSVAESNGSKKKGKVMTLESYDALIKTLNT